MARLASFPQGALPTLERDTMSITRKTLIAIAATAGLGLAGCATPRDGDGIACE